MSLIITFMFDPAKLQMNCASASGASSLRVETERRATSTGRTHHGRGNRSRTRGARGVGNHGAARLFSLVISMGSSAACSAVARPNCDQVAQLSPPPVGWARSVPPLRHFPAAVHVGSGVSAVLDEPGFGGFKIADV